MFEKIIKELSEFGWKYREIADEVGADPSFISRLASADRKEPGYFMGLALVELHKKEARKAKRRK